MRKIVIFLSAFCITTLPLFTSENEQSSVYALKNIGAIIINPAHGGRDPGAIGTHEINGETVTYAEKNITLSIAHALKEKLIEAFPNITVILTRENDTASSLAEITNMANSVQSFTEGTSLFISIHANASLKSENRGFNIYTAKNDTVNLNFAEQVSAGIAGAFGNELPNRGIAQESYYVISHASMPAIMVDLGFVTNMEDALLLYSEQGLDKCSTALARGIAAYIEAL